MICAVTHNTELLKETSVTHTKNKCFSHSLSTFHNITALKKVVKRTTSNQLKSEYFIFHQAFYLKCTETETVNYLHLITKLYVSSKVVRVSLNIVITTTHTYILLSKNVAFFVHSIVL